MHHLKKLGEMHHLKKRGAISLNKRKENQNLSGKQYNSRLIQKKDTQQADLLEFEPNCLSGHFRKLNQRFAFAHFEMQEAHCSFLRPLFSRRHSHPSNPQFAFPSHE